MRRSETFTELAIPPGKRSRFTAAFLRFRESGVLTAYKIAGVLLRAEGVSAEAIEAVELAERLTRDTGFRALEPDALLVRAELEPPRGDEAAREHALQEAHRILVEIGATARRPSSASDRAGDRQRRQRPRGTGGGRCLVRYLRQVVAAVQAAVAIQRRVTGEPFEG